jgi:fibro-slime domain-containing protein
MVNNGGSVTASNAGQPAHSGAVNLSSAGTTASALSYGGVAAAVAGAGGEYSAGNAGTAGAAGVRNEHTGASCGDGVVDARESCDSLPMDRDLGDGCSPTCQLEPACPSQGGACTTRCGDALVAGDEGCDDGNLMNGDGCSATCAVEAGFECNSTAVSDPFTLPLVVRDFDAGGDFEKGSTFAMGLDYATQELLQPTLDATGRKPVLQQTAGRYNGTAGKDSGIASAASFAQWFDDAAAAGGNTRGASLVTTLILYPKNDGSGYVNRFGNGGDGLTSEQYLLTQTEQCGVVGEEDHDAQGNALPCTVCYYDPDPSTPQCDQKDLTRCQKDATFLECEKSRDGRQWNGVFVNASFDGNPIFFPADPIVPANPATTAQISGNYNPSWPSMPGMHNFSFTTETRFWFRYDSGAKYRLTFEGDDDVWIFVNKHLALDLGGIHLAVRGELTIDLGTPVATVTATNRTAAPITSTPDLGTLTHASLYEVAIFHAERQSKASSYRLDISPTFRLAPSQCHAK